MMTQLVRGKSAGEIEALRVQFREMVMGNGDVDEKALGSLRALRGVAKFPARVTCALLAWNALAEAQKRRY